MQIYFLFIPLYFVLNFLMKSSSLSFLTKGSWLWTFSNTVTFISLMWCPGRLKWAPVAFDRCLFVTYALCSLNLSWRVRSDSPIYCILQCWQKMQYIIFCDLQLTEVLMSIFVLFDVALTPLQGRTKGQIGHLLQVFMPGMFLYICISIPKICCSLSVWQSAILKSLYKNCHNPNLTTTQLNITKVGFDTKMTLHHHYHHHHHHPPPSPPPGTKRHQYLSC